MIRLVPAQPEHIEPIASRMRAADKEEVGAFGRSPDQALHLGLISSVDCYTAMIDGKPEGILGLRPLNILEGEGAPWLLGTEELYRHPRAWLHLAPKIISRWRDSTKSLSSLVGKKNARAIRLLRRLGFQIGGEPMTIGGVEFVTFSMETDNL